MADVDFAGADEMSFAVRVPAAELCDGIVAESGFWLEGVVVGVLLVETVVNVTI